MPVSPYGVHKELDINFVLMNRLISQINGIYFETSALVQFTLTTSANV